jgi:hypothetical protein
MPPPPPPIKNYTPRGRCAFSREKKQKCTYKVRAAESFYLGTATLFVIYRYISIKRAAAVTARWILTWPHWDLFSERRCEGKSWCGEWIFVAGALECWVLIDWIVPPLNHSRSSFCIQPFRNINTIMVVHHHRCVFIVEYIYIRASSDAAGKKSFWNQYAHATWFIDGSGLAGTKLWVKNRSKLRGWQICLWFTLGPVCPGSLQYSSYVFSFQSINVLWATGL